MAAAEWELSKENYIPVKSGRRKATLAEVADPADTATKQALEQQRRCPAKQSLQRLRKHSTGYLSAHNSAGIYGGALMNMKATTPLSHG